MDAIQGELELGKQHHFRMNQFRQKKNKKIQCLLRSGAIIGRSPAMIMLGEKTRKKKWKKDDLSESKTRSLDDGDRMRAYHGPLFTKCQKKIYIKQMEKKNRVLPVGIFVNCFCFRTEPPPHRCSTPRATPAEKMEGSAFCFAQC